MEKIPCFIMRGGTSKAVFFRQEMLPKNAVLREKLILAAMGSPHQRQIDGLGGADMLTSKVAIIGKSDRVNADVDYTFCQVGIDSAYVDYNGNCGNISSAVGLFALEQGLVPITEPVTSVRIYNTNTNTVLVANVSPKFNRGEYLKDCQISGVPATGARVDLDFSKTAGAKTGKLLPTGNTVDIMAIKGLGEIQVSFVDVANPVVFVNSADLGLTGLETLAELESQPKIMNRFEAVRSMAAYRMGFADNLSTASEVSPALPFLAVVTPPRNANNGEISLKSTIFTVRRLHKAYAVTGAVCTAVATRIVGSVANRASHIILDNYVIIAHPSGTIEIEIGVVQEGSNYVLTKASLSRTARMIMEGNVFIPLVPHKQLDVQ